MNIPSILLLFVMPVLLSGTIALLLRKNHIKVNVHRKYFTVKIINGIALIVSLYNLAFTSFWIRVHKETLSFYQITTLTKMTMFLYYFILPIDLLILAYIIFSLKQKYFRKDFISSSIKINQSFLLKCFF
jgi:hypothetical protein